MGEFLAYSLVSGLLLLALFLGFKVLLSSDNQPGFNRSVLLIIYAVSFLFIPIYTLVKGHRISDATLIQIPTDATLAGTMLSLGASPLWSTVMIWVSIAGMTFVAIRTLLVWIRLLGVIRNGERVELGGTTFILTEESRFAPFSWVKYIVMSRDDFEGYLSLISAHERKHIVCHHWIDLLIAQIVCIINWFNPAAWLMRDELMLIHEYQADLAVIEEGHDPRDYQMLLIKKAVGARSPSLANSLNHSKLKKRITMMHKEKSGAGRRMKALALVPVLALAVGLTGVPAIRAAVTTISTSRMSVWDNNSAPEEKADTLRLFKVVSLNDDGIQTTITVKGENLGSHLTVSGGKITSDGQTCDARQLNCNMTDGSAVITAIFPRSGELKHPSLTLNVNGKDVAFDLDGALTHSPSVKTIHTGSAKIYVDNVEVTGDQLAAIDPESIESIEIDKRAGRIVISLKK